MIKVGELITAEYSKRIKVNIDHFRTIKLTELFVWKWIGRNKWIRYFRCRQIRVKVKWKITREKYKYNLNLIIWVQSLD